MSKRVNSTRLPKHLVMDAGFVGLELAPSDAAVRQLCKYDENVRFYRALYQACELLSVIQTGMLEKLPYTAPRHANLTHRTILIENMVARGSTAKRHLPRCVYDQRGWGESNDIRGEKHSLAKLTSDALQVIRNLNVKNHILIGHSMGGKLPRTSPLRSRTEFS